jgi:hypothetical protein
VVGEAVERLKYADFVSVFGSIESFKEDDLEDQISKCETLGIGILSVTNRCRPVQAILNPRLEVWVHPLRPELHRIFHRHHCAIIGTEQLAVVKDEAFVHLML